MYEKKQLVRLKFHFLTKIEIEMTHHMFLFCYLLMLKYN